MEFIAQLAVPIVTLLVGFGGAYFVLRGKYVERDMNEVTVEAETTGKFLDGQVAFQKYVDDIVSSKVQTATAEMRQELDDLAGKFTEVQTEYRDMANAISSRETRLWLWRMEGYEGEMPTLPAHMMDRLGIGHLNNLATFTFPPGKM